MRKSQGKPKVTGTKLLLYKPLPTVSETDGSINFQVSMRLEMMKELAGWRPDRIEAFFGGIAKVLADRTAGKLAIE